MSTNFSFTVIYCNYILNIFSNRMVFKNSTYENKKSSVFKKK